MIVKKIIFKLTIILIISVLISSCKSQDLKNTSTDFTKEFLFTKGIEGPAVDSKGNLFAVNFHNEGTIGKIDANGKPTLFATLPKGSIGNGIRFDKLDNMYIADYAKHNILMISNGTTKAVVYAHDSTLNQPNDIAIAPNGTLYASDPNWKASTGNIWLIKNNTFILLEKNMGTTNGIEVSPDGKKLYVNESVQGNVWVYDILADGTVANKELFIKFSDFGMDGMRCDEKGNLYICRYGKGTVAILSPEGKLIREITLKGKDPTNITFGGKDKKQCFVTLQDRGSFETFQSEFAGRK